jgi:hypothetical protein
MAGYASKASPLAPLAAEDPLTKDQWRNLLAFADTVVPAVVPDRSAVGPNELPLSAADYGATLAKVTRFADASLAESYLLERASDLQPFKDNIYRLLSCYVPTDLKQQLALGLTLLKYGRPRESGQADSRQLSDRRADPHGQAYRIRRPAARRARRDNTIVGPRQDPDRAPAVQVPDPAREADVGKV